VIRRAVAAGVSCGVVLVALGALLLSVPDDMRPIPAPTQTVFVPLDRVVPGPTVTATVTAEPSPAPTVTVTREAAVSRSRASTPVHSVNDPVGFAAWLASPKGKAISWRESHNICDITNPTGKYQGKWQMDDNFWRSYGGLKYAPNPHQATCHEQDLVAYRGWLARGWQPWGG
jgi:Transglycosylase-like domain